MVSPYIAHQEFKVFHNYGTCSFIYEPHLLVVLWKLSQSVGLDPPQVPDLQRTCWYQRMGADCVEEAIYHDNHQLCQSWCRIDKL